MIGGSVNNAGEVSKTFLKLKAVYLRFMHKSFVYNKGMDRNRQETQYLKYCKQIAEKEC